MPAKAGIQVDFAAQCYWVPAFAGTTAYVYAAFAFLLRRA